MQAKSENTMLRKALSLFKKYQARPIAHKMCTTGVALTILLLGLYLCGDYQHNPLDSLLILIGAWGFAYSWHLVRFFFSQPIERDIILAQKSYWYYVLLLVIAIPVFCSAVLILSHVSLDSIYQSNPAYVQTCASCETTQIVSENEHPNILWDVYYHFVDPGNQHDTTLKGKIYTGILGILGIFLLDGLLITTLIGWVDQRKDKWQRGRIRYQLRHLQKGNYAIVIGANEIAASVIKNLLATKSSNPTLDCLSNKENQYVLLQTSSEVENVRDVLASHLTKQELEQVIIYNALRDSEQEIAKLHLEHATEIYILGENTTIDGGENYHDSLNMRCLNLLAEYLRNHNYTKSNGYKRKVCRVMFDYQATYSVFQFSDVSKDVKETLEFVPFNRYEAWARKVFVDCEAKYHEKRIDYTPLDGYEGIKFEDNQRVHLVIVGMSKMGVAMGVQALLQLHFPNYVRDKALKTRITFIDTNADKEMAFFRGRYTTLFELARYRYVDANQCNTEQLDTQHECGNAADSKDYKWIDPMKSSDCRWKHLNDTGENFIDVELEFVKGELESEGVRDYLRKISDSASNSKLTIALCLTQTHQAVAAALYMPIEVYNNPHLQQILVYQREADDIVTNLLNVKDTSVRYKKLRPFGMLYGEYIETRRRYFKAQLVNMAYSNMYDNIPWPIDVRNKEDVGTIFMRRAWSDLPISLKISNKFFGDTIYQKMRSMMTLPKEQAVGGYHNAMYNKTELYDELDRAFSLELPKDMDDFKEETYKNNPAYRLAQTEHNRWNLEKLLMGFSPMNKEQDEQFRLLVREKKNKAIKQLKKVHKSSATNIHPNICDFHHLRLTDKDALGYDVMLHNAIPNMLLSVDGYKTTSHYKHIDKNKSEYYLTIGKLVYKTLNC